MDNDKKNRFEKAISHLVNIGLIDAKDVVKDIIEKTERHPNNVRGALRGEERFLTKKFIKTFCAVYDNIISADWILEGTGSMVESTDDFSPTLIKLPSDSGENTKPRLPVIAAAGRLSAMLNSVMEYHCEMMPVIKRFPDYDFTMFIRGNSMEPKYEGGDEIAVKKATIIEWGKDYVLDTYDGAIFKKIYEDGDNIRCVSYNHEEYPDFLIPKSSIYGYYRFVGLIRT